MKSELIPSPENIASFMKLSSYRMSSEYKIVHSSRFVDERS